MKKLISILLVLVVFLTCFAACADKEEVDAISRYWQGEIAVDKEKSEELLAAAKLRKTEIELVKDIKPTIVRRYEFERNGDYRTFIDGDPSRDAIWQYYSKIFEKLYEKREELEKEYDAEFDEMSEQEFITFLATERGHGDGDIMIDVLMVKAFDYDKLDDESMEVGKYTLSGDKITIKPDKKEKVEYDYFIKKGILTLKNGKVTENYKKLY